MAILRQLPVMFWNKPDLVDVGPQFPSDKQTLLSWIVSDAVQHGFRVETINWTQNPREVNPADDITGLRRDPGNAIAVPHIGEDLSLHEL